MPDFDLIVVGAGPSGSACATVAAQSGLKVLLLEKARFPREKICGDCINPSCWPVLDRLGVSEQVLAQPHSKLGELEFVMVDGHSLRFPLHPSGRGEIAIKRSHFDRVLFEKAGRAGAEVREGTTVNALQRRREGWELHVGGAAVTTRFLVGADGRNSSVAHMAGVAPVVGRDRVAIQTHLPCPAPMEARVVMRLLKEGYCGLASVGNKELNLCLVSRPEKLPALKAWAVAEFAIDSGQQWRAITPLSRKPAPTRRGNLLLVGDAARVVEPFTGEGIYYALASGELAAKAIVSAGLESYPKRHAELYRGRLWVNRLAKEAVLHPRLASCLLRWGPRGALHLLTRKIVGEALAQ